VDITAIMLGFFGVLKIATIFAFVLCIIWINRRYGTRKREAAMLTEQESQTLDQLVRVAEKMEGRLATLESILDAEHPKWKERV
jgi:phage shock protein B